MLNGPNSSPTKIFLQFLRFGLLAWGGPVAQIGMIKQELVDEEKNITPEKFKRVLAVYQVLPGPEAHELCVYFGMLKGKRLGGFLAGLGFMLPGFVLMLMFSWLYVNYGNSAFLLAAAYGIQPAVSGLIIRAIYRIGQHVMTINYLWVILVIAIVTTLLNIHFGIMLTVCGLLTILFNRQKWLLGFGLGAMFIATTIWLTVSPLPLGKSNSSTTTTVATTPVAYFTTGLKSGLLTFGGAYTILPFLEHDAVKQYAWLSESQLVDGIALASIFPAPLVIIATFVGYVGNGLTGALLMTLGVFLPAFAFTLFGHSLLERLIQNTSLHHFLNGVAVGVVGLIVVTAVRISMQVIQSPLQLFILAIALLILYKSTSKFTIPLLVVASGSIGVGLSYLSSLLNT